jgi:hypothetical protein
LPQYVAAYKGLTKCFYMFYVIGPGLPPPGVGADPVIGMLQEDTTVVGIFEYPSP